MLYSQFVKSVFRACYGEPPDLTNGRGDGLVLVADGCGGLDLCAVGLRYVMGALRAPAQVRVVSWGHGFGHWHADLTDTPHLAAQAAAAQAEFQVLLGFSPGGRTAWEDWFERPKAESEPKASP